MRIIAGEYRSRSISVLRGTDVRPTPDRLRESLFSVLAPQLAGCTFVDAYAGCGSVGLEALSRGAGRVVFIEWRRSAVTMIRRNLASLGVEEGFEVYCAKAAGKLATVAADIVFLDPPYPLDHEYAAAFEALAANPATLVVAQHSSRRELPERYGPLVHRRTLRQGDNCLSFYERPGD